MADPFTLTALTVGSMAASAAGAGVSAFGAARGGAAQRAQYQYMAAVAQQKRLIDLQNAQYEIQVGGVKREEAGMKERYQIGQAVAGLGASNLSMAPGTSSGAVIKGMRVAAQTTQGIIGAEAARRAYGFQVEAAGQEAQAGLYTMAGAEAETSGYIGMVSSILGGAGAVADKWTQASMRGVPGFAIG